MIFVGVDRSESCHDVHVQDEQGQKLGGGRLPEGVEGLARFHELAARHAPQAGDVVIGIETDRGLFAAASGRPCPGGLRRVRAVTSAFAGVSAGAES